MGRRKRREKKQDREGGGERFLGHDQLNICSIRQIQIHTCLGFMSFTFCLRCMGVGLCVYMCMYVFSFAHLFWQSQSRANSHLALWLSLLAHGIDLERGDSHSSAGSHHWNSSSHSLQWPRANSVSNTEDYAFIEMKSLILLLHYRVGCVCRVGYRNQVSVPTWPVPTGPNHNADFGFSVQCLSFVLK